jgi:hypothetical protein
LTDVRPTAEPEKGWKKVSGYQIPSTRSTVDVTRGQQSTDDMDSNTMIITDKAVSKKYDKSVPAYSTWQPTYTALVAECSK